MKAVDLIENLREEQNVIKSISKVIFGSKSKKNIEELDDEERLSYNLSKVRTFNIVKDAVWSCAQTEDARGNAIDKSEQNIDMSLLNRLMLELSVYVNYYELDRQY